MDNLIPFSLHADPSALLMLQLTYGGFCDAVFFLCVYNVILLDDFIFLFCGSLSSSKSYNIFIFY